MVKFKPQLINYRKLLLNSIIDLSLIQLTLHARLLVSRIIASAKPLVNTSVGKKESRQWPIQTGLHLKGGGGGGGGF